jgi:serine/threonine-protein kinase
MVATEMGLDRYEDLGLLGRGGMGEVRRVRDRHLNRVMAMKTVSASYSRSARAVPRFIEEAQATAQLQHPGIVPVHELGRLADGRLYFTMQEVRGRQMSDVIREVHGSPSDRSGRPPWNFRRLVSAFWQVCSAVAFAHDRGVLHRDLKPGNIMLGEFGEAHVVDWGLARVVGRPDLAARAGDLDVVVTNRSLDDSEATRAGTVAGTPAYMAPEQARGDIDMLDARTDIYALGAVLYEILTGRPPYEGADGRAVHRAVLQGPPPPPDPAIDLPEDLVEICNKAMARAPEERYARTLELVADIASWLDGAKRREKALALVELADAKLDEAAALREHAADSAAHAKHLLAGTQPWDSEAAKAEGWAEEDRAEQLLSDADMREVEHREMLRTALNHDPKMPEADHRLAAFHIREHRAAEARRDRRAAAQSEKLIRSHDRSGAHAAYLKGTGALTLVTDPPGAEVLLYRYVERTRRLETEWVGSLGRTPLQSVSMEMGSYLCLIRADGRADVRYPVHIGRGEHWHGIRPGDVDPTPIRLPRPSDMADDDCYIPAGFYESGGDAEAYAALPGLRRWVDEMVFKRFPVTNREYLAFLNDILAQGREEDALKWVPSQRTLMEGTTTIPQYARRPDGCFDVGPDAEGDVWDLDWPVVLVDWYGAMAYAAWLAERTDQGWRLPGEFEWEKAGRGVDGRYFPWGDFANPSWCSRRASVEGQSRLPVVVDSFPVDASPYGVRGMAGNVKDWCIEPSTLEPDQTAGVLPPPRVGDSLEPIPRSVRGGSWISIESRARLATRQTTNAAVRYGNDGLRVIRRGAPDAPLF